MSLEARKILTEYWGYQRFRPMQEEIIDSVLQNNDTFALMPTGGGKSLTFQIPALVRPGCCLVITPLISLMKDQVDRLKKMGIKAKAIYTGMYWEEIDAAFSEAIYGKLKFLYVSPERLMNENFQQALAKVNINLIAVDEAHCISQWGYQFRPPYLRIAEIRQFFPKIPVLAVTATATPKVVDDIIKKLNFKKKIIFKASFERKNIAYRVEKESDKTGRMLQILKQEAGSSIVYVRNRRKTRELAEILIKNNVKATYYHAGLEQNIRNQRQNMWFTGKVQVIVATNAFGMGIDKSDVRKVIHYNLPDCIESYFQEAGRAGRDGKPATAILLYNNHDIGHSKKQLTESYPDIETIRNIYNSLGNYFQIPVGSGKDMGYSFKITEFASQYNFGLITVYSTIKLLEKEGFIFFKESAGRFSKLKFKVDYNQMYRYIVENARFEVLLKQIMRSYGGVFSDYVNIDEKILSKRTGIKPESVYSALAYLSKIKIISYVPLNSTPQIFYNTERLPKSHIGLSPENYENLKKAAQSRLDALLSFINNHITCRSIQLLSYFGEKHQHRCGICDVCTSMNKMELSSIELEVIQNQIMDLLLEKPRNLYELVPSVKNTTEEKIIKVIQWLLDQDILYRTPDEKIHWKQQMNLDL